ncbi:MAG TPA: hypothetical protein VG055_12660 [Planctomycetaceae bacterium]|nr:hypothetical protein [Planctomycetaceae bacterium]
MESTENRSDVLRLEYACTPAERKEAESFVLAQTLGGDRSGAQMRSCCSF